MADRPIIFSATMVRALLDGRKTQTRRILGKRSSPRSPNIFDGTWSDAYVLAPGSASWRECCIPYAVGDRLYVREAWQTGMGADGPQITYKATPDFFDIDAWDGPDEGAGHSFNYERCSGADWFHWLGDVISNNGPWRSPIHMPRWASRLTLTVTDVRVQRLQDISGRDVIAEGLRCDGCYAVGAGYSACRDGGCFAVKNDFRDIWNSLHGPEAWDRNPWVAALTFTVAHGNIDRIGGSHG